MKEIKWRSILALLLIVSIIYFNWTWGWAIVFMLWLIPDLRSGVTFLMDPIERKEHPFLYWTILTLWALLSILLLLDEWAPQTLPKGWSTTDRVVYQSQQEGEYVMDYAKHMTNKEDRLLYKNYVAPSFNVVGISALTTFKNNEVDFVLKELWDAFIAEDISPYIPNIIDDKIYVVQSNFDQEKEGYFQVTIGYKTTSLEKIDSNLTGVEVQASKYAVVELEKNPLEEIGSTWEKIALSDLEVTNLNNVEVYHYDNKLKRVTKVDIWVAVPTPKKALEKLALSKKDSVLDIVVRPMVKMESINQQYVLPKATESLENSSKDSAKNYPTHQHNGFAVVGLQATFDYNNEEAMQQGIEKLWDQFFKKNYAKHIYDLVEPSNIYVAYTNYKEKEVTVTLGYRALSKQQFKPVKGLKGVLLPTNNYYVLSLDNKDLSAKNEEWEMLEEVLPYRSEKSTDFEVYTFDKNYDITNAYLWIGAQ